MGKGKYQSNGPEGWMGIAILVLILIIIVALVVILFRACGSEDITEPETSATQVTEPETSATEPTEPETTATEPTEPETTATEPTEPETTATEPTEPETTATEPTEPEITATAPTEPNPTEPTSTAPTGTYGSKAEEVEAMALSMVGQPEKSPEHPEGYDVGSFIYNCFHKCGLTNVPRDFNSLLTYGKEVTQRQNGDVVVFRITPAEGEPYDYIGIVVEDNQFVAISSSSEMVIKRPLSYFASYPTVYRRFTDS